MTDQINIQEYKDSNRKKKVPTEIIQRWKQRVIPRGLHQMGSNGAVQYLSDYGKGMGAPKCVLLALQAEQENAIEMANEFWDKAYELEFGCRPVAMSEFGIPQSKAKEKIAPAIQSKLPFHLQPGNIITMQPVDAEFSREYYISNPGYMGMPKRDGEKLVVIVEDQNIYYQSRSQKLRSMPDIHIDTALRLLQMKTGNFILEGELVYFSWRGSEHRTGSQAAKINMQEGHPEIHPMIKYCVFDCLMAKGIDTTTQIKGSRWAEAYTLLLNLSSSYDHLFEMIPIAVGSVEKRKLADDQKAEGREGEIWARDVAYQGGKHLDNIVRTKYRIPLIGLVTGLTSTTAAGRPFGAMEISFNGRRIGNVGTGYTNDQMWKIKRLFDEYPGKLEVMLSTQGFTEDGNLFLGVFEGFIE